MSGRETKRTVGVMILGASVAGWVMFNENFHLGIQYVIVFGLVILVVAHNKEIF